MKEIKKKVIVNYEYGNEKKTAEVFAKTWEELFDNLRYYANGEDRKLLFLTEVETVEVETKYSDFAEPGWGKKAASDNSEEEI